MEMNYSQNANCIYTDASVRSWIYSCDFKTIYIYDYVLHYQDIYHFCYVSVLKFLFSGKKIFDLTNELTSRMQRRNLKENQWRFEQ